MESNICHLANMIELFIEAPCDNIRLLTFEGANLLTTYDASACAVRKIPDVLHLTSLTRFDTNMSQFECNTLICWMLIEDLSNPLFRWLTESMCKAPVSLRGVIIRDLSPVKAGCYRGKGNKLFENYVQIKNKQSVTDTDIVACLHVISVVLYSVHCVYLPIYTNLSLTRFSSQIPKLFR